MKTTDTTFLSEARDYVLANRDEGVICPCCDQNAQTYRVGMSSSMAVALITIANMSELKSDGTYPWIYIPNVPECLKLAGAWAKIRYFDTLIEEAPKERPDGGHAGWWRISTEGMRFVRAGTTIPKFVFLYNGEKLGQSDERVTIKDALGKKFDLRELLNG